jgi:hypothetical protein
MLPNLHVLYELLQNLAGKTPYSLPSSVSLMKIALKEVRVPGTINHVVKDPNILFAFIAYQTPIFLS